MNGCVCAWVWVCAFVFINCSRSCHCVASAIPLIVCQLYYLKSVHFCCFVQLHNACAYLLRHRSSRHFQDQVTSSASATDTELPASCAHWSKHGAVHVPPGPTSIDNASACPTKPARPSPSHASLRHSSSNISSVSPHMFLEASLDETASDKQAKSIPAPSNRAAQLSPAFNRNPSLMPAPTDSPALRRSQVAAPPRPIAESLLSTHQDGPSSAVNPSMTRFRPMPESKYPLDSHRHLPEILPAQDALQQGVNRMHSLTGNMELTDNNLKDIASPAALVSEMVSSTTTRAVSSFPQTFKVRGCCMCSR